MIAYHQESPGGVVDGGRTSAIGIADWLCLAAAPTFAAMALLTSFPESGPSELLCSVTHGSFSMGGMSVMYAMMSAVHLSPWLRRFPGRRNGSRRSSSSN